MRRLIGDLLEAGRVEAGALSVAPRPVAVGQLLEAARQTFLGVGGRHAVRVDLAPDLPRVAADSQRIVQVLNNLISNAARHSPESSSIHIGAARRWRARRGLGVRRRPGRVSGEVAASVSRARLGGRR